MGEKLLTVINASSKGNTIFLYITLILLLICAISDFYFFHVFLSNLDTIAVLITKKP